MTLDAVAQRGAPMTTAAERIAESFQVRLPDNIAAAMEVYKTACYRSAEWGHGTSERELDRRRQVESDAKRALCEAVAKVIADNERLTKGVNLYRAKRMSDGGPVKMPNGRMTQPRPWDAMKHYDAEIAVDEWEQEQERR